MTRIHPILDIFSAAPGEKITLTIAANNTVFAATPMNPLNSGQSWILIQPATPANPVEIRSFVMPNGPESFTTVYQFSAPATAGVQSYDVTFTGAAGTSDGPIPVKRPQGSSQIILPYSFNPPAPGESNGAPLEHLRMAVSALPPQAPTTAKKAAKKAAKRKPKKAKKS